MLYKSLKDTKLTNIEIVPKMLVKSLLSKDPSYGRKIRMLIKITQICTIKISGNHDQ